MRVQRMALFGSPLVRATLLGAVLLMGAMGIALFIGIAGPILALAFAVALVGGILILLDTHWGFVALAVVAYVIPFASLPVNVGFRPTFLDAALGALFFVWIFRLAIGRERRFLASPLGLPVALFMLLALFSFLYGLSHSAVNSFFLRRFAEILLGIALYFVVINLVRTKAELVWVTRWVAFAGAVAAAIAVVFYVIPEEWTVAVLDRLARFDYPGGFGALRWIEDDPDGTMRAIGLAVDPNVLGGMMILSGGLLAPQLFARQAIFPRWVTLGMLSVSVLALYLTYSRSALLGLAAAIAVLAVLKYRRLIVLGAVGAVLLLVLPQTQAYVERLIAGFAGEDLATQMRFGEYQDALTLIGRYPLFGVGFTGVPDIDLYLGVSMLYLIIAENMGLVGLSVFILIIAIFIGVSVRGWHKGIEPGMEGILLGVLGAITGALVSGIFDHYWFNMTYPHMTVLFWLFLGLAMATLLIQEERRKDDSVA